MRTRQSHIPPERLDYALKVARLYIDLTRVMHGIILPDTARNFGAASETMLVFLSVFIGDAENRPMSAPKIADYIGVPRASVYRRIDRLVRENRIERAGRSYRIVPGTMRTDPAGRVRKLLENFNR